MGKFTSNKKEKYTVTLTEEQMRVVQNALEEYFRLRMGQDYSLSEDLASMTEDLSPSNPDHEKIFDRYINRRTCMNEILCTYFRIAFGPMGCPNKKTDDMMTAECIWDAFRLARGLSRLDFVLPIGSEPVPEIKKVETDTATGRRHQPDGKGQLPAEAPVRTGETPSADPEAPLSVNRAGLYQLGEAPFRKGGCGSTEVMARTCGIRPAQWNPVSSDMGGCQEEKIKQLEEENASLRKNIKNLAEQAEQAELILYEAWIDSGEENAQIEKAGRMLLNAYMPIKSFDEFWKISPSHYDHVDPVPDMAKRASIFRKFTRIKRAAYASESYTDWQIAKDIPLEEIACRLKESQIWDLGLLRELCRRAGMLREWQEADAAAFEHIAAIAAKKLGVDIGIPEDIFPCV